MSIVRNGLFVAIVAHSLIGASLVWDKILLVRIHTQSVVNYVFWLGAMSILGTILIAFGFKMPSPGVASLGFVAGVVHLAANFFYYAALKRGEASQTLAIMGGFAPTATALFGLELLKRPLAGRTLIGFAIMVAGGFFMFFSERFDWKRILPFVLAGSVTFGLTNVMQKIVFDRTNFVSGYVFFTLGTFAGSLLLLLRPSWREQIVTQSEQTPPRSRFWYFVNRLVNGFGSFLVFFAISRENPAIVDAISGLRYAVIFLLSFWFTRWKPEWLHEEFSGWAFTAKTIATSAVVAGLVVVGLASGPGGVSTADRGRPRVRFTAMQEDLPRRRPRRSPPIFASAPLP
jgi:drug/metabolite transporter (DMT)-like permease